MPHLSDYDQFEWRSRVRVALLRLEAVCKELEADDWQARIDGKPRPSKMLMPYPPPPNSFGGRCWNPALSPLTNPASFNMKST
jgi:hypothetical protein